MRRLVVLIAILSASAASAQVLDERGFPVDTTAAGWDAETGRTEQTVPAVRESFRLIPLPRGDFEPAHTSAAAAYAYSAAATLGTAAVGYGLYRILPDADGTRSTGYAPNEAALFLVGLGGMLGPYVGNLTLGAGADVQRTFGIISKGLIAGGIGMTGAVALVPLCFAETDGPLCQAAGGLLVASAAVMVVSFVGGAVYTLARIPANARAAQRYVEHYGRVELAPASEGAGFALRVRL